MAALGPSGYGGSSGHAGRLSRDRRDLDRLNRDMERATDPAVGGPARRIDTQTGDLFAWGAKQRKYRDAGSISLRRPGSKTHSHWLERSHASPRPRGRLGSYLYSGSFGRLSPMRHTDGIQRNRVVFVCLVLGAVVYVIYRLVAG